MTKSETSPTLGIRSGRAEDPGDFQALTEIIMVAHLAEIAFGRALPDGLTTAQFGVLNRLVRLDGMETVGQLARAFQVAQPTMSSTVGRLVDAGLVERVANSADRRLRHIRITETGRATREAGVRALDGIRTQIGPDLDIIGLSEMLPELRRLRETLEGVVL